MSRTVQQVNVELSKLRAEVEQLSSDRDSARH
jgi:outer membrane murein-binding lipoprotein Lpp